MNNLSNAEITILTLGELEEYIFSARLTFLNLYKLKFRIELSIDMLKTINMSDQTPTTPTPETTPTSDTPTTKTVKFADDVTKSAAVDEATEPVESKTTESVETKTEVVETKAVQAKTLADLYHEKYAKLRQNVDKRVAFILTELEKDRKVEAVDSGFEFTINQYDVSRELNQDGLSYSDGYVQSMIVGYYVGHGFKVEKGFGIGSLVVSF